MMNVTHNGFRYVAEQDGISATSRHRKEAESQLRRKLLERDAYAAGFVNRETGEADIISYLTSMGLEQPGKSE